MAGKSNTRQTAGNAPAGTDSKSKDLEQFRSRPDGEALRTNQGVKIADNQNTLRAGPRGPSLLEDFIMREKITHFDHERIPERIVHARGSAAHGVFQVYKPMSEYTKAAFLQDPAVQTPVYVRFSTVQGPRGSADTVRDVRGFAVKFYTQEGNYDLVGNNMPVFFIQDAIKFPDFVHAVKPEAPNEMPTGGSAHETFWDFGAHGAVDHVGPCDSAQPAHHGRLRHSHVPFRQRRGQGAFRQVSLASRARLLLAVVG
jgi:catalase